MSPSSVSLGRSGAGWLMPSLSDPPPAVGQTFISQKLSVSGAECFPHSLGGGVAGTGLECIWITFLLSLKFIYLF